MLAYVAMNGVETLNIERPGPSPEVVFVSPKNKFKAVRHVFSENILCSIDSERQGRELKSLSLEITKLSFDTFVVEVGLNSLRELGTKLDDVSDVFPAELCLLS